MLLLVNRANRVSATFSLLQADCIQSQYSMIALLCNITHRCSLTLSPTINATSYCIVGVMASSDAGVLTAVHWTHIHYIVSTLPGSELFFVQAYVHLMCHTHTAVLMPYASFMRSHITAGHDLP